MLAVALLAESAATPAFAIWPFTRRDKVEEVVPDPVTYTVDIEVVGSNRRFDRTLRNASSLYNRRETPTSGAVGLLARARQDIGSLTAVLYQNARYAGEVAITIGGRPLDSWSPFDPIGPQPVPVRVVITAGPQFVFGTVRANPLPPDMTIEDLRIAPGEIAESGRIISAEDRIVGGWRDEGYPLAAISGSDVVADHGNRTLDVTITVDPGPIADFGRVTVSGTDRVKPTLIEGRAGIDPGTLYSPRTTRRAEQRLRDLGVFESVRIVPADHLDPDGTIPVEIIVSERKRHVIGAGVNYSNTEGAGAEIYWADRNLWGGAESLRLSAEISRLFDSAFNEPDYRLAAKFKKPAVFDPMTDFTLRAEAFRDTTDAYRATTQEIEGGLSRVFTDTVSGSVLLELENTQIDEAVPNKDYLIATLTGAVDWDTRDNRLDPTRGFNVHLEAAPAYDFLHDEVFATFKEDISIYQAIDAERRFILAGRVQAGVLTVENKRNVAASRRLYAGGAGSVRGYGYENIGPRNKDGDPVGGRSNFAVSGEVRYRISDSFGVVAFVDAGNAYRDIVPDVTNLKVGVGGGIRYLTPVGPLRVDLAVPLDPRRDDPSIALYVGLGQAF
ncbi:autotransporter assembly complex protein TamA [Bauldia litoralis]|uniref:Autotransporter secretion outer membrane protein TamA n=1 Tax=Bauldia litoralis TaxID=665467 RepID=A0A1G6CUI7_9HYPH|nr:autotransporter assembly complex family protein [Bauldia litoralis]SDB36474.1 autotransporter secretion outer membrane protein TamA [Bauldia litoralis]